MKRMRNRREEVDVLGVGVGLSVPSGRQVGFLRHKVNGHIGF